MAPPRFWIVVRDILCISLVTVALGMGMSWCRAHSDEIRAALPQRPMLSPPPPPHPIQTLQDVEVYGVDLAVRGCERACGGAPLPALVLRPTLDTVLGPAPVGEWFCVCNFEGRRGYTTRTVSRAEWIQGIREVYDEREALKKPVE